MLSAVQVSPKELMRLDRNYAAIARKVRLQYVSDTMPGISRVRKGTGFAYLQGGKRVSKETRERIRKLVIPPAWTAVWICASDNGHIQATGYDVRKRKQYRYHALWSAVRNETKFHKLQAFGKALPALRERVEKDLIRKELCQEKVLATIISLMERTYIRIGNEDYEKLYGSHGMTTLKDNHVTITGGAVRFSFVGKKGIAHAITMKNKRLAKIVKQCRDIPGKELFQYYDSDGVRRPIDSGMVNDYIKDAMQADFTAKDFRTWAGTLNLLRALKSAGEAATEMDIKKNIVAALDEVSMKLGNTRAVCRKYYVHPQLIALYEKQSLHRYLKELDALEIPDGHTGLTHDEKVMMKLLG